MSEWNLDITTAVAVGSALVHADELLDSLGPLHGPADFDANALRTCLQQSEVVRWLESFPGGLLPVKRDR
jgi:hypothetical protein